MLGACLLTLFDLFALTLFYVLLMLFLFWFVIGLTLLVWFVILVYCVI